MQATSQPTSVFLSTGKKEQPFINVWVVGAAVACTLFFGMVGVLCWGLDRGFDPVVEGFFVLSAENPQIYPTFTSFHFFLNHIPHFVANDILRYRVAEVVTHLGAAALLAFGFCRWSKGSLKLSRAQQLFITALACIGGIYGMSFFPRTMSYNGIASTLVLISSACMFLALPPQAVPAQADEKGAGLSNLLNMFLFVVSGFALGLDWFDKVSSSLGILAMMSVFLIIQGKAKSLLLVVLGMVAAAATYFGFFQSPADWWHTFSEGMALEGQSSHGVTAIANEAGGLLRMYALPVMGLGLASMVLSELFKKSAPRKHFQLLTAITGVALAALAATTSYLNYETCGVLLVLTMVCTALIYPILNQFKANSSAPETPSIETANEQQVSATEPLVSKHILLGYAFLFLIPCLVSVGTNCDPFVHVGLTIAPWFMLIGLGCFLCEKKFSAPVAALLLSSGFLIFTTIHFVHRGTFARMESGNLLECTTPVQGVPALTGIKLKPEAAQAYQATLTVLKENGYEKGDPVLCLYDEPGIVYAVGATSPGQSWYVFWPQRDELNAHYLSQAHLADASRVFLLTTIKPHPKVLQALDDQGVPPSSFELVNEIENPLSPKLHMRLFVHRHGS